MEKTSYGRARTCGRDRLVLLQRPAGNLQRSARNNPQPTLIAELKVRRSDPATAATAWRVTAFDQRAHAGILAGVPVGVNRVRAVGGRRLRQVMPEKRLRIGQYRPIKRLRIGLDGLPIFGGRYPRGIFRLWGQVGRQPVNRRGNSRRDFQNRNRQAVNFCQ